MDDNEDDVKVTPAMIRSRSGQFDLETVITLNLTNMKIRRIEGLSGCSRLCSLDISDNCVTMLPPHSLPVTLRIIRLCRNSIKTLHNSAIEQLVNLERLSLDDNLIEERDELLVLIRCCPSLRSLSFLGNPLCSSVITTELASLFSRSKLEVINGERVVLLLNQKDYCSNQPSEDLVLPASIPWFDNVEVVLPPANTPLPGESSLSDAIRECNRMLRTSRALLHES